MHRINAHELSESQNWNIVDLRSHEEREALGFIPGSLVLPTSNVDATVKWLEDLVDDHPIVIYCTSGARSEVLVRELVGLTERAILDLEGGVLAWQQAGLPCSFGDPDDCHDLESSPQDFLLALRSCFVGQTVETILDHDIEVNPVELFEQCQARTQPLDYPDTPSYLRAIVDHAAHISRLLGTSLDSIARNVDWAYSNIAHHNKQLLEQRVTDCVASLS